LCNELKGLSRDGLMSDAELEALMVKLGDKKRPIDEVRDFSLARQALKEWKVADRLPFKVQGFRFKVLGRQP